MKKFKFNLEAVLIQRKRSEDLKLREWVAAQQIVQRMEKDKKDLEGKLKIAIDDGGRLAALPENNVGQFIMLESFIKGTKLKIQWKTNEIERAVKLTERKRLEYVGARQKREVLEKLKTKRLEEYKKIMKKKEFKDLDDIYINMRRFEEYSNEEEVA